MQISEAAMTDTASEKCNSLRKASLLCKLLGCRCSDQGQAHISAKTVTYLNLMAAGLKVLVPLHAHCNALHSEIDRVDVQQQTTAKQLLLSAMEAVESACTHA